MLTPAYDALLQLMLCGQTPDAVADAALFAINFYVEQQRLTGMYDNQRLKSKMAQMQSQCKKKLVEMQNAFQQASAFRVEWGSAPSF